ncbi:hypothetical protein K439DRAFT_89902 [Ramaria rubella]|nr:hypothetical protein K439DRAFT_89902 [Ramaria rubella]
MNSSSFLLPPELLLSFSDEWSHRAQCCAPSSVYLSEQQRQQHRQQPLDDLAPWQQSSSCSSKRRRFTADRRHEPTAASVEVPELSHTPLSSISSLSGSANLPSETLPAFDFTACYVPDFHGLPSSGMVDLSSGRYPLPEFSFPSYPWANATEDELLTIHSPKPVFAYRTFDFDFDRPRTPGSDDQLPIGRGAGTSRRKRCRDDEDEPESAFLPKKRKMSAEAPHLLSLFPDASYDLPSEWCQSPTNARDVFSMEKLLDCTIDWNNPVWPGKIKPFPDSYRADVSGQFSAEV